MRYFLAAVGLALYPATAVGATLTVAPDGSGEYPTIQAAADAASDGDTIELLDGMFTGPGNRNLELRGLTLTIKSRSGQSSSCWLSLDGNTGMFIDEDFILEGIGVSDGDFVVDQGQQRLLHLRACTFSRISGIAVMSSGPLIVEDCAFTGIEISGIACVGMIGANCEIVRTTFQRNGTGCQLLNDDGPDKSILIEDCAFVENRGPAIYALDSQLRVENCEFVDNGSSGGAALFLQTNDYAGADVQVRNSEFVDNKDGALFLDGSGGPLKFLAENVVFASNISALGTVCAVGSYSSQPAAVDLVGCTFHRNSTSSGAIHLEIPSNHVVRIVNTIVSATIGSCAVSCEEGSVPDLDVSCCDFFGNEGGDWTGCVEGLESHAGNFSADPLFCAASEFDFSIRSDSPCAPKQGACGLIGALSVGCVPVGACCDVLECECIVLPEAECTERGAQFTFQGADSVCDPSPCDAQGACCFEAGCILLTCTQCDIAAGGYRGPGTSCDPEPCHTSTVITQMTPLDPQLQPFSPNPASASVEYGVILPSTSRVLIELFDMTGRRVVTVLDAEMHAGFHALSWRPLDQFGDRLPAGLYQARLQAGGRYAAQKLVIVPA